MIERDPTVVLRYIIEETVLGELRTEREGYAPAPDWRGDIAREIARQVLQRLADLKIEVRR